MDLFIVTAPTVDPLSTETAKKQCRMEGTSDDDAYFKDVLIPGVRDRAELATQRALLQQVWDLKLDGFPCEDFIELPKPPLISVTSVSYVDTGGTSRTMTVTTDYVVHAPSGPRCKRGRVALAYGTHWPSTRPQLNAVTIRFVCGYGDEAADLPPFLVNGMLIDLATLFEHREGLVTGTIVADLPETAKRIYRRFKSYPTQVLQ